MRWLMFIILPLLACSQALGDGKFWRSYVEFETRAGDHWTGQGNLFLPLAQTEVNMLFADLRGNWSDLNSQNGNLGLGFRQMLINDWIFGINAFYDMRHSQFNNNFSQAGLGLEMLNVDWGVRWNGYLAGDGAQPLSSGSTFELVNIAPGLNQLRLQSAEERAYSGHDFEVERRLWFREAPSDNSWYAWRTFNDMELWASVGVYKFDANAAGFEDILGPRTRMELRIYDIAWAGPDSRLVVAGQFENDDVRGMVSQASFNVRIPFGRTVSRTRSRLRCLNRRMVAPIERNTDIISVAGRSAAEDVAFAKNGRTITNVIQLDGSGGPVDGLIEGAGTDSLVLLDGTAGPLSFAGTADLLDGQTVLGGGSQLQVTGLTSGTVATFTAPGSRPTVTATSTAFELATESCLIGFDVATTGAGSVGVNLASVTNALIDDVSISTTGDDAHGISSADSTFQLAESTINTSGDQANGVNVNDTSLIGLLANLTDTSIATSGDDAHGIAALGRSFVVSQNSQIFTSGDTGSEGIFVTDNAQAAVIGGTITATGPNTAGIFVSPEGTGGTVNFSLTGTTINATGDGVLVGGQNFTSGEANATLVGNTILTPIGVDEIEVTTNALGATANASIESSVVDPLSGTIRLDEIAGDINVSQEAVVLPGSNGIPSTNVLIPNGAIDFEQPAPSLPTP